MIWATSLRDNGSHTKTDGAQAGQSRMVGGRDTAEGTCSHKADIGVGASGT